MRQRNSCLKKYANSYHKLKKQIRRLSFNNKKNIIITFTQYPRALFKHKYREEIAWIIICNWSWELLKECHLSMSVPTQMVSLIALKPLWLYRAISITSGNKMKLLDKSHMHRKSYLIINRFWFSLLTQESTQPVESNWRRTCKLLKSIQNEAGQTFTLLEVWLDGRPCRSWAASALLHEPYLISIWTWTYWL